MTAAAPTRVLHVANGTSTTGTIHKANIPGSSSVWADALHEGPVPETLSDDELMEIRARHEERFVAPLNSRLIARVTSVFNGSFDPLSWKDRA